MPSCLCWASPVSSGSFQETYNSSGLLFIARRTHDSSASRIRSRRIFQGTRQNQLYVAFEGGIHAVHSQSNLPQEPEPAIRFGRGGRSAPNKSPRSLLVHDAVLKHVHDAFLPLIGQRHSVCREFSSMSRIRS